MRLSFCHLAASLGVSSFIVGIAPAGDLELSIVPVADGAPLTAETSLVSQSGEHWSVSRLSYLLSEASLQRRDGSWLAIKSDPAWLSLGDKRSTWRFTGIPAGDWSAIRFSVGLPPSWNEPDPAAWGPDHPLNPNLNGLHWSWQGGYIFLALEGRFWKEGDDPATAPGFAYHLAREPYRAIVSVPVTFQTRDHGEDRLILLFDLPRIIDGASPLSFAKDGSSTHSKDGDPLAAALRSNLQDAFRAGDPDGGAVVTQPKGNLGAGNASPSGPALVIPAGFPRPNLPPDLNIHRDRVELGRLLFHETSLSKSNSLACASCHLADHGLADARRVSPGEQGRLGRRNAMPLFNLAWKSSFFWDGRAASLREQVLDPIQDHQELDEDPVRVVEKLSTLPAYPERFANAFGSAGISVDRLAIALETFLLTLVSHDSKFDRARRGETKLTDLEQRGFDLFMTEREPRLGQFGGDCFHCHGGALFTDHQFRNNGLALSSSDPGRGAITQAALDLGTFSTPSLRNIALTAPYMHDGRFTTLEEVLDHYSEGVQRTRTLDPNLAKHPDGGLGLSPDDKVALIAFLKTLTDDQYARDAYLGEP